MGLTFGDLYSAEGAIYKADLFPISPYIDYRNFIFYEVMSGLGQRGATR